MDGGHLRGFFTVVADITQIKEAQVELESLNRALKSRTLDAEAASLAKGLFLANMSHELRTPMNAILGLLQLLQRTELTARQFDYISKTETSARSLLGILNDILDFSKVDAGKMQLEQEPFRIDRLMRELSVILAEGLGQKNVEILFAIDPQLPSALVGDAMRLKQVLINLASNAVKFTPEGEVVVSLSVIERDAQHVNLYIAVRDTGIGISAQNQQHIFDGFTQAEASTTRRFGGTGLGLAISQRLVQLMGGELLLESALGLGSMFHFTLRLPLASAEFNADPGDAATSALRSTERNAPLRILVVDDNDTARGILAEMAASFGWQVDSTASGEEALAMAQADGDGHFPYQAVLIDWRMPGMDGWEAAQQIRRLRGNAQAQAPVIIMVTAHGREMLAERQRFDPQQLDGFLVKPVTASMLFDAVMEAGADIHTPRGPATQVSARRLAGCRILVVEDNPTNQQVAQELLGWEGAQVMLANDGRAGVEAVEQAMHSGRQFDCVLMDIQMPVMDGYAATAEIRQRLGLRALPIIAMTANAMPSDRLACLAADMNEHVGKPFDLDLVVHTILRQIGAPAQLVPDLPPVARDDRNAPPVRLDIPSAMARMQCGEDFYNRLVDSFLHESGTMQARLNLLDATQRKDALHILHTLKSLAGTIGANRLAQVCTGVENWLKSANGDLDLVDLVDITQTITATQQALHAYQASRTAAPHARGPDGAGQLG
jgi:signal transduction histidine kinase/CheY-like chemotaxis protein